MFFVKQMKHDSTTSFWSAINFTFQVWSLNDLRIGDATAPVGEGTGIDGVLSLYLKENSRKIKETRIAQLKDDFPTTNTLREQKRQLILNMSKNDSWNG